MQRASCSLVVTSCASTVILHLHAKVGLRICSARLSWSQNSRNQQMSWYSMIGAQQLQPLCVVNFTLAPNSVAVLKVVFTLLFVFYDNNMVLKPPVLEVSSCVNQWSIGCIFCSGSLFFVIMVSSCSKQLLHFQLKMILPAPHVTAHIEWVAVKRLAAGGILYFTQRVLKEDGALSLVCQMRASGASWWCLFGKNKDLISRIIHQSSTSWKQQFRE